ncbi:MAG: hypothetical protein ACD_78C00195G0001, partial [uncultured bacterium (gcode 4)]
MAPIPDIPTVRVGRTIEHRVYPSVGFIFFVLGIIRLLDPRHRHPTISPE